MPKDKRYLTVKNLITGGYIKKFSEIIYTVPKSTITRDLGMHHQTFKKVMKSPDRLSFTDAFKIASFIEIDEREIMNLIHNEWIEKKDKRKK
jgi:hypothetical protein